MRHVRTRVAMLFALLLAAACADAPTAPNAAGTTGSSSDYLLDPVIVIGTPQEPVCDPYTDPNWCQGDDGGQCTTSYPGTDDSEYVGTAGCGTNPGSGPGDGDSGGGGSAGDEDGTDGSCTADENGTRCESVDRPECERKPDATAECVTRFPSTTEWAALGQTVDRMTENTDYCRGAKAIAREVYAAGREGGRMVLWDGRNYVPGTNQQKMIWGRNSSDYRGRIIQMDSYLAFEVPSLLAHEALHAYLNSINWLGTPEEQEAWVSGRESECAG